MNLKIKSALVSVFDKENIISLLKCLKKHNIKINSNKNLFFSNIDTLGLMGDFIESQAFAYLAVRSIQSLPLSFPKTTGCKTPSYGGEIIEY